MDPHALLPPKPQRQRQAVRWHIGNADRVSIHGVDYTCIENSEKGYIFARVDNPEIKFPYTVAQFDELKELQSFRHEKNGMDLEKARALLHSPVRALMDLPEDERQYVKWKVRACQKFLRMERMGLTTRGEKPLVAALAKIQSELDKEDRTPSGRKRGGRKKNPSHMVVGPKRFLQWVSLYVEHGPLGLVDRYHNCGNREPYYTEEEYEKLAEYARKYCSPERPTIAMLHNAMEVEIEGINATRRRRGLPDLRVPDDDRLRIEIRNLPAFDVMAAREGEEIAINFFRAVNGGVPDLVRPMQRVEADEWMVHLHTLAIDVGLWAFLTPEMREKAKKVRVWVGAAICCTTRCVVGLTVAPTASSESTRMLLRMALADKSAMAAAVGAETPWEYRGSPDEFVVDEGPSNINDDIPFICADLGIAFKTPQAEMPTQRGKIERLFYTVDLKSITRFSGRTFKNPVVRGKYESRARACVTVHELCALLVRFIVDEYHNTPHAGLGGETPRRCWLDLTKKYPPTVPPGRDKIRTAFGEDMRATLEPTGIRVFGNFYRSPRAQTLFETVGKVEVDIRVDTEDLGAISLKQPGGWLTLLGPEDMNGISLKVWGDAQDSVRRPQADLNKVVWPVARRAIAYAIQADQETRKRLLVQYRPMSGADFEHARRRLWIAVEYRDENVSIVPAAPPDLFDGALPTGGTAPRRIDPSPPAALPAPTPQKKTARRPGAAAAAAVIQQHPRKKPRRKWQVKER
jgi:putative transposase